jgi:hypothetical protein
MVPDLIKQYLHTWQDTTHSPAACTTAGRGSEAEGTHLHSLTRLDAIGRQPVVRIKHPRLSPLVSRFDHDPRSRPAARAATSAGR